MKFSYHRGAISEDFEGCKIRCFFGRVLGGSWGGFLEGLKTDQISKPKLEPQKIQFLKLKRRQDGSPNFHFFFKNRLKILAMTVFGLRSLLEASKRLPRASQEPPQSPQEDPPAVNSAAN